MEEFPTGENLAQSLKTVAESWGIDLAKAAVTTDNASNIVSAMEQSNILVHV